LARFTLSPKAQRDLEEIWDFSTERWGEAQAETYVRSIRAAIETVAADPRRGRPCDEVRPGYRKLGVGSHLLFYRQADAGIEIIRILHQRMDAVRRL
jgi:toxin ParE1/3/4